VENTVSLDIQLRDVRESDLSIFYEYEADADAARMVGMPVRERDASRAHWARSLADATVVAQTIVVGTEVAGNIVSYEDADMRQVGYWLGREFWGRGIATRTLALFLRSIDTRPLYARAAAHNAASIRVLEKCGFAIVSQEDDVIFLTLSD
jgi:RimJ/RimL family protein N-acetyltransferase